MKSLNINEDILAIFTYAEKIHLNTDEVGNAILTKKGEPYKWMITHTNSSMITLNTQYFYIYEYTLEENQISHKEFKFPEKIVGCNFIMIFKRLKAVNYFLKRKLWCTFINKSLKGTIFMPWLLLSDYYSDKLVAEDIFYWKISPKHLLDLFSMNFFVLYIHGLFRNQCKNIGLLIYELEEYESMLSKEETQMGKYQEEFYEGTNFLERYDSFSEENVFDIPLLKKIRKDYLGGHCGYYPL